MEGIDTMVYQIDHIDDSKNSKSVEIGIKLAVVLLNNVPAPKRSSTGAEPSIQCTNH